MGHEYIHAGLFKLGGIRDDIKSHATIYDWQYQQAEMWKWNVSLYKNLSEKFAPFRDGMYDYYFSRIGIRVISSRPF